MCVIKSYQSFDDGDETHAVFLDLSKAFDKVWHKGLLYKMKRMGIADPLLNWFHSYLSGRCQQVVIGGCESRSRTPTCGVSQGSVLGPLLFLIYVNDIGDDLECDIFLFADDASLFKRLFNNSIVAADSLNRDLARIHSWCKKWLLVINVGKTKCILFSRKRSPTIPPPLYLNNNVLECCTSHTQLGMVLDHKLNWCEHIDFICNKAMQRIHSWKSLTYKLSRKHLELCMNLFIFPILDYGDFLYDNCLEEYADNLESVLIAAARVITGAKRGTSHQLLYRETGWKSLRQRRQIHKTLKMYDIIHNHTPSYMKALLPRNIESSVYRTRGAVARYYPPYKCKSEMLRKTLDRKSVV